MRLCRVICERDYVCHIYTKIVILTFLGKLKSKCFKNFEIYNLLLFYKIELANKDFEIF